MKKADSIKNDTGVLQPQKGRLKRRIVRVLKIVILLYCSIGIALYYLQEKFLFHPEPLAADYKWNFDFPFEEINIAYNKKENFNIVRFLPKDSIRKGAVIYFHGNMENLGRYAKFSSDFTSRSYEVWMADYPGFGKTTGELTEKKLYDQASQVYKLVSKKFKADSIIIYGKSLGTGIATQLASENPARLLILETPYYSIPDLFDSYAPIYPTERMSKFKIPLASYLEDCVMPVIIFHGHKDEVIPFRSANKLKTRLKTSDEFIELDDARHNNITSFEIYQAILDSLLK